MLINHFLFIVYSKEDFLSIIICTLDNCFSKMTDAGADQYQYHHAFGIQVYYLLSEKRYQDALNQIEMYVNNRPDSRHHITFWIIQFTLHHYDLFIANQIVSKLTTGRKDERFVNTINTLQSYQEITIANFNNTALSRVISDKKGVVKSTITSGSSSISSTES